MDSSSQRSVPAGTPKLVALFAALAAFVIFVTPGLASHDGAPGNDGTIKVHDDNPGEPDPEVKNQPHVCRFDLHFFFGDAGQTGDWWIKEWPPTSASGPSSDPSGAVLAGTYEDPDLDREDREPDVEGTYYTLPDGHYKLFWEGAPTPSGRLNIKHKVFWVDCPEETSSPSPTEGAGGGSPSPSPGEGSPSPSLSPSPSPGEGSPSPSPGEGSPSPSLSPSPGEGSPSPSPTGGQLAGTPTPTPREGQLGGVPSTATNEPSQTPAFALAVLMLASLSALAYAQISARSNRRR